MGDGWADPALSDIFPHLGGVAPMRIAPAAAAAGCQMDPVARLQSQTGELARRALVAVLLGGDPRVLALPLDIAAGLSGWAAALQSPRCQLVAVAHKADGDP